MRPYQQPLFSKTVAGITAIALGFMAMVPSVGAQTSDNKTIQDTQIIFNDPTPPQQGSPSGRQRGGASRGNCRQFESLTALLPAKGKAWGQTMSDRPTVWVYLPAPLTEQTPIEFVVQDAADNYVYNTRMTNPTTKPGLIRLSMPVTTQPLEVGKAYTWTLSVYCDPAKPSSAVFVKGIIQRVAAADLQAPLAQATPLERVRLYAARGLWYDALTAIADLYQASPNQPAIGNAWRSLLQQTNLEPLTQMPFSSCCTPKP